jgi:predicted RNase H-like HicB family nuclease
MGGEMRRVFTLEYWLDEGWYVGKLKEVPGVFSHGESLEELEENIRDAYLVKSKILISKSFTPLDSKHLTGSNFQNSNSK